MQIAQLSKKKGGVTKKCYAPFFCLQISPNLAGTVDLLCKSRPRHNALVFEKPSLVFGGPAFHNRNLDRPGTADSACLVSQGHIVRI